MSGIGIRLPGGRGQLSGKDAPSVRGENLRQRAKEVRLDRGWAYSTVPAGCTLSSAASNANTMLIFPVEEATRSVIAEYATASMETTIASNTAQIALYTMRLVPEPTFVQLAGSKITLNANDSQVQKLKLTQQVSILAGQALFVGFVKSHSTARVYAGEMSVTRRYWTKTATTSLPEEVSIASLAGAYGLQYLVPAASYISADAERIF